MEPHPHDKKHEHGHARGSLKTALIITATFLVAEFLGALYTNSLALLADAGHMLTDVAALSLSLFAMRFASLAIIMSGYQVADPLISIVVAVLILWSSWILIRDAVDILLEGTPSHINIVSLREQLGRLDGVGSVHDLHVWTLTSGVLAMSCHVVAHELSPNHTEILTLAND